MEYFFISEIIISLSGNYQESLDGIATCKNKQGATIDKPESPEKMFNLSYSHLEFLFKSLNKCLKTREITLQIRIFILQIMKPDFITLICFHAISTCACVAVSSKSL